jgi:hypothetical protein
MTLYVHAAAALISMQIDADAARMSGMCQYT